MSDLIQYKPKNGERVPAFFAVEECSNCKSMRISYSSFAKIYGTVPRNCDKCKNWIVRSMIGVNINVHLKNTKYGIQKVDAPCPNFDHTNMTCPYCFGSKMVFKSDVNDVTLGEVMCYRCGNEMYVCTAVPLYCESCGELHTESH